MLTNDHGTGGMVYADFLSECGLEVDRGWFYGLNEEAKIQVTDDTLNGMMKFIADHYNAIDFKEIERSGGDIAKFKYTRMLHENVDTLLKVYQASDDPGAKSYVKVAFAIQNVMGHLEARRRQYADLYRSGNGLIQVMYTSLVAACVYSIGILVSNTIRFVTSEKDTECQVLFDEIPGSFKNVHIKNITAASESIATFNEVLDAYSNRQNGRNAMSESVSLASLTAYVTGVKAAGAALLAAHPIGAGITIGVVTLMALPRILALLREIIYSIYFMRVKLADMLAIQADLLNTNVEALESRGGPKKVIARQKKIVEKLTKWQNIIALKVDTVNAMVSSQKSRENRQLNVDPNSPLAQNPGSGGELML